LALSLSAPFRGVVVQYIRTGGNPVSDWRDPKRQPKSERGAQTFDSRLYTLRTRAARRPSFHFPHLKVTATATARGHFNKNLFLLFHPKRENEKTKQKKNKKSNGIHFFGVLKADDVRLRVAVAKM
jgi:hypothetical protein